MASPEPKEIKTLKDFPDTTLNLFAFPPRGIARAAVGGNIYDGTLKLKKDQGKNLVQIALTSGDSSSWTEVVFETKSKINRGYVKNLAIKVGPLIWKFGTLYLLAPKRQNQNTGEIRAFAETVDIGGQYYEICGAPTSGSLLQLDMTVTVKDPATGTRTGLGRLTFPDDDPNSDGEFVSKKGIPYPAKRAATEVSWTADGYKYKGFPSIFAVNKTLDESGITMADGGFRGWRTGEVIVVGDDWEATATAP